MAFGMDAVGIQNQSQQLEQKESNPEMDLMSDESDSTEEDPEDLPETLAKKAREMAKVHRKTISLVILFWFFTFLCLAITGCWIYYLKTLRSAPHTFTTIYIRFYSEYQAMYEILFSSIVILLTLGKFFFGRRPPVRAACEIFAFIYNIHFYLSFTLMVEGVLDDMGSLRRRMNSTLYLEVNDTEESIWDITQEAYDCCGLDAPEDWVPIIQQIVDKMLTGYDARQRVWPDIDVLTQDEGPIQMEYPVFCCENETVFCSREMTWSEGCYPGQMALLKHYGMFLLILQVISLIIFHLYYFLHNYIWKYGKAHRYMDRLLDKVTDTDKPYEINPSLPL